MITDNNKKENRMNEKKFTYGWLLWLKIIVAVLCISYFIQEAYNAFLARVSVEKLAADEYSTDFEYVAYAVLSACFINYLILCLLRQRDHISFSGGLIDINIHRHTLFLFSNKHIRLDPYDIREFKIKESEYLPLLLYGVRVQFFFHNGKKCTYPLIGIKGKIEELEQAFIANGVKCAPKPQETKKSQSKDFVRLIIFISLLCILIGLLAPVAVTCALDVLMPGFLWIPIILIGMFFGAFLRDLFSLGFVFGFCMSVILGIISFLSLMLANNYGADRSGAVFMTYKVADCSSVYHPATGTGRRRRHAHTNYYFSIYSLTDNRLVRRYGTNKKLYSKARKAESVTVPVRRGLLGYPVIRKSEMVFKKKEVKSHYEIMQKHRESIRKRREDMARLKRKSDSLRECRHERLKKITIRSNKE